MVDVLDLPVPLGDQLDRARRAGPAPTVDRSRSYLSIIDHFDDFGKGVIDTTHVIYYLSFITFGLFLTAKSVDSERWRG